MNIFDCIVTFLLMLYADTNLPRKIVAIILNFIVNFIKKAFLPDLLNNILEILNNDNISNESIEKVRECFECYGCIFDKFSNETKRFSAFKKKGLINYEEFKIGDSYIKKKKKKQNTNYFRTRKWY